MEPIEMELTIRELFGNVRRDYFDTISYTAFSNILKELEWKILCCSRMKQAPEIDIHLKQLIPIGFQDLNNILANNVSSKT